MISNYTKKWNAFFMWIETRVGLIATSLLLALLILAFDMLYTTPHFEASYHGLQYSLLSNDPFDFSYVNPLRNRILPSFIGYITHLRGGLFFIVPLSFAVLLVASIYWFYRRKKYDPVDAFLFTGLIAFSCTIFIQLAGPGYTDAVFYFFLFWSFATVKNIRLSAMFYALALLTHESSLFLLPGLILYSHYLNKNVPIKTLKHAAYLLLALLPMLMHRVWVNDHVVEGTEMYNFSFYFSIDNIISVIKRIWLLIPVGAFFAFKLFWFFPIYAMYKTWKAKEYSFFSIIAIIILCDLAQMLIAFDVTRMLCLGFPAILLSAEKVKSIWEPKRFTRFFLILTLVNFLVLQFYMGADGLYPMFPSLYNLITGR